MDIREWNAAWDMTGGLHKQIRLKYIYYGDYNPKNPYNKNMLEKLKLLFVQFLKQHMLQKN
jgi:hypothetical protein